MGEGSFWLPLDPPEGQAAEEGELEAGGAREDGQGGHDASRRLRTACLLHPFPPAFPRTFCPHTPVSL